MRSTVYMALVSPWKSIFRVKLRPYIRDFSFIQFYLFKWTNDTIILLKSNGCTLYFFQISYNWFKIAADPNIIPSNKQYVGFFVLHYFDKIYIT